MTTGIPGSVARRIHQQTPMTFKQTLTFNDLSASALSKTIVLGYVGVNSVIAAGISGVYTHIAFNGTTLIDIGTAANNAFYSAGMVTTALGFVALNVAGTGAVAGWGGFTGDVQLVAKISASTAPTTGLATVVVVFYP